MGNRFVIELDESYKLSAIERERFAALLERFSSVVLVDRLWADTLLKPIAVMTETLEREYHLDETVPQVTVLHEGD